MCKDRDVLLQKSSNSTLPLQTMDQIVMDLVCLLSVDCTETCHHLVCPPLSLHFLILSLSASAHTANTPHLSTQALRYLRLINLCWGPLISTACRQELATAAGTLWAGCQQLTYLQSER